MEIKDDGDINVFPRMEMQLLNSKDALCRI